MAFLDIFSKIGGLFAGKQVNTTTSQPNSSPTLGDVFTNPGSYKFDGGLDGNLGAYPTKAPYAPPTSLKLGDVLTKPYLGSGPLEFNFPAPYDPTKPVPLSSEAGGIASDTSGSMVNDSGAATGLGTGAINTTVPSVDIGKIPKPTLLPNTAKVSPPLTAGTTGVIPAVDFVTAGSDPAKMSEFMGKAYQGVTELQSQYNTTRASQPKSVEDQKKANLDTGYDDAKSRYLDVQRRVQDFNATVNNIEYDVRRDLGGEVTESAIQAEITNRMRQLNPQFSRLSGELAAAQTDMTVFQDAAKERYTAMRSDAEEAVNQVAQKLGFQNANVTLAGELFNQVKNYEITADAQKDNVRDDWRTLANTLVASPALLYQASNQDLANIASMAQMPLESLTSLKKVFSQGQVANLQLGDDGALGYAIIRPDGSWVFGKQQDYAKVIPKASSSSSSLIDFANFTEAFVKQKSDFNATLQQGAIAFANDPSKYRALLRGSLAILAEAVTNSDEKKLLDQYAKLYGAITTEYSVDEISSQLTELSDKLGQ